MRHTKIVATLGPASRDEAVLDAMIASGVDIFRLNFSHGTHDTHAEMVRRVRQAATRAQRVVAIMQDLSGPKIRTGSLIGGQPIRLITGAGLRIATGEFPGTATRISTAFAELAHAVQPGDRLLLDDGRIELTVESSDGSEIVTRVVDGGVLGEHKGINAPGVLLPASATTPKDLDDLRFGIELGVDMVAVSFVQTADDLRGARAAAGAAGADLLRIIAKIERPQAVANLEAILNEADAVMVARGDLGLELPLERVPRVQKEVTRQARARGVPVILATQVLESMREEPRPTRAEVSDAANAVDAGVDAIMLAGETAVGAFPVRVVQTLDTIIRDAEASASLAPAPVPPLEDVAEHGRALCEAAVSLAARSRAEAIVAVTRAGKTARLLSRLRPSMPIYAATDTEAKSRRLTLFWGVVPLVVPFGDDADSTGAAIRQLLLAQGALAAGALVVFVNVSADLAREASNFLKLQRLEA